MIDQSTVVTPDAAINRMMNRAASSSLVDVDVALMVVDRTAWTENDERVLSHLVNCEAPVILVVNKVDLVRDKSALLPCLEALERKADFAAIVPLSALRKQNMEALEREIVARLPQRDALFPDDQITDKSMRFLAAEIVREKIMRQLGDELPYATAVEVEEFVEDKGILHISALILVERRGQKLILIGEGGGRLRSIGSEARRDMEKLFDNKVMLRLWVKIKSGWSDDDRALKSLGYDDPG